VPFAVFDCRAALATRHRRLERRWAGNDDASEAEAVRCSARAAPPQRWTREDERAAAIFCDAGRSFVGGEPSKRWRGSA